MKYKVLITSIQTISSPITVKYGGKIKEFSNGEEMSLYEFESNYRIDKIYDENGGIIVELVNNTPNIVNWVGEEEISFF